ncbi:MAG: YbaN family protein [Deltaproteobacteria bacterium]|nr:YbaN family protein [Deltaproteobacteria bacterium]
MVRTKNIILTIIGLISLLLGVVGIVVPLLPTTPFLLLSAVCFLNGSPKLHFWLVNHKYLGRQIAAYQTHRAISKKTRAAALTLLWGTILFSVIFIIQIAWIKILLLIIALSVSIYLLRLKTLSEDNS